jgi:alkanesulfonate monooxygenase SsuD/methylene tetrahydromethanopterin reductase-like flavin-dependent oxidoreductase (luciferase family)
MNGLAGKTALVAGAGAGIGRESALRCAEAGANVVAADNDAEARRLFTSAQQSFTNLLRGERGELAPPMDDIEAYWTPGEKAQVSHMLSCSFVGSPPTVRDGLRAFVERTRADEIIVVSAVHDHGARLRSYELLADIGAALRQ